MCDKIPEDALSKTTKCVKDFSCLSCETRKVCSVTSVVGNKLLFIDPVDMRVCPYKTDFGLSYICSCPVRYALYARCYI
ncbi:MAG: hypothetical protein JXD19_06970 [Deltaproteobacteria bacterium]|nr:hypothetical protein [Deltaproteobacteria bacterium]